MTALTVGTEFSIVYIIAAMALATSHRQLDHVFDGLPMAVVARNGNMRAFELEICLQVVVEEPNLPVHGIVTTLAGIAEATVMRFILTVTIHTRSIDVFKYLRLMACAALFVDMLSEQRETGQIVIE